MTHYAVQIGDRVTDEAGTEYEVTGVLREDFRSHSHYEAMLRTP
ncbi:hypothetical protein ACRDNQ_03995 [Palleronia sp. KMU-117]